MVDLTQHSELVVRQEREMVEVFTSFETENKYSVQTPDGAQLLYAYEESGTIRRQFMGTHRPLSIHVVDGEGSPVIEASRDFYWLKSHLRVSEGGRRVGTLNRQLSVVKRKFTVNDANDRALASLEGSVFRPYTFVARGAQGNEMGRITKQWGGIGREMFTDADTFRVEFNQSALGQDFRLLMLAAAFAIDLDFFEQKG